jgi:hypothetical protein
VFDFYATDPSHGRQAILVQQVVGFVVETPLTQDEIGSRCFHLVHHVNKVLLFGSCQLVIVFDAGNFQLVFGLRLGWLKGTGQDAQFGVPDLFRHVGM